MGTLTVLLTVFALILGGQALFLDVLRLGLVLALLVSVAGLTASSPGGPLASWGPRRGVSALGVASTRRIGA